MKIGMFAGPVRRASATWVAGMSRSDGAKVELASASPSPVIVWQAAQFAANSVAPSERLAPWRLTCGMYGVAGHSVLRYVAIASAWRWSSRAGRRIGWVMFVATAGMRPDSIQKSMVAGPTCCEVREPAALGRQRRRDAVRRHPVAPAAVLRVQRSRRAENSAGVV